ncbi:FAD dependent oxidoreductase [Xylariaceae sp. FL0804]|nr:FAD dependent oxidoreductase [Xylariaceae sp. FL0804]
MQHVVVLGAGVIGLSAALRIQADGHQVTVLARDLPAPSETIDAADQINYTSPWGGAHNRWIPPPAGDSDSDSTTARDHAMARRTFAHMRAVAAAHPEAGVTLVRGVEYLETPDAATYGPLDDPARARELGLEGFRRLGADELPRGVAYGCEYDTWCVSPMVYCMFLLRRIVFRGGRVVRREVRDPAEVFEMRNLGGARVDALVNASGIGFGDKDVFVTRGQTCLVANRCDATVTRQNADGSWTFSVPRNFEGGTVIGGTKEPDNWDPTPSLEVREKMLKNFAATYPQILDGDGKFTVVRDIVGRRPTRKGGMRLEKEVLPGGKCIIHAYGLGGRGFELSWGVAEGVASLLAGQNALKPLTDAPQARLQKL